MAGIATQFKTLQLTRDRLASSGDPALERIAQVMDAHPQFAHLGALGPSLADFLPAELPRVPFDQLPKNYTLVWKMFASVLADTGGLYALLQEMRAMLAQISAIADSEDTAAICALRNTDFTTRMEQTAIRFQELIAALMPDLTTGTDGLVVQVADVIVNGLRPPVNTPTPADPVPGPETWPVRDFLSWRRGGELVANLLRQADESNDDRLRAYAYGYVCAYSLAVCGSPFTASTVGGPHRTQWWRRRLVDNYVDAWVHGYYRAGATMSGDTPTPAYATWENLGSANIQQLIELSAVDPAALLMTAKTEGPFAQDLPPAFTEGWMKAFERTYGVGAAAGRFTAGSLNGAYLMTWLKLWFRTSGQVLPADPPPPLPPPDDCGDAPGELDPFTPSGTGGPSLPPSPQIDYHEDTFTKVCGIILAILGGLLILAGAGAGGAIAIAAGISLLDCESLLVVNWKKLRCDLYWYRVYIHNAEVGLHNLLKFAGFAYPYARELEVDQEVIELLEIELPFEAGRNLVRSRPNRGEEFPSKPALPSLLDFNSRPTAARPGFERPPTIACYSRVYPHFFIDDDAANPLANGRVGTPPNGFPFHAYPESERPVQFGNAVANAVDLLRNLDSFPNWNLDADRGLAYVTWAFRNASYDPDNVQIDPA